ncbi:unnamed protein product [Rhizoctonia solani]|uniref:Uncharacterized protein n=1 Tax=Rhizoctonia solani TaxID=456999 RepID=A0A8H3ASV4_9AGAM|nr:unnamed protein product [Rhizoctonia solani]
MFSTQLWSLITLSDSPPFSFSALCLDRSGTTTPLEIEIRLSNRLWGYLEEPEPELYTFGMLDALEFIVENGGTTSRWKSFWLYTPGDIDIEPHETALGFIQNSPMPALERFEIKYDGPHYKDFEDHQRDDLRNKPLFLDPPTRLKAATLEWIPNSCLFTIPTRPQLVGLTRLEIMFPETHPELERFHALLSASPALSILSIDTRRMCYDRSSSVDGRAVVRLPKIHLPNLRALALLFSSRTIIPWWEHSLLLMLNAPNVESLRLWLEGHAYWVPQNQDLVEYIAKGPDSADPKPLFPYLTGLELFIKQDRRAPRSDPDEELLAAYPGLRTLVLPHLARHNGLRVRPWLVPSLVRLIIHVRSPSELEEAIYERCAAGMAPKVVEVPMLSEAHIEREGSKYSKVLDGLGVEVCFSHSNHRVREALRFEEP